MLLRGCPVLEELYVRHENCEGTPYCICSPNIKKLSVYYDFEVLRGGMSFNTPSLVFLSYRDHALEEYTDVNLASLVEARLDIHYSKWIEDPDLTGLIIGISNVKTLHLSPASADVIARCVEDELVLPVFKNLVKLSFGSYNERGWKLLPYLIKQSPKLKTLIIQGLDGYAGDVTIRPFQVKVLHDLGLWRNC